jgi:hypothetical protein
MKQVGDREGAAIMRAMIVCGCIGLAVWTVVLSVILGEW